MSENTWIPHDYQREATEFLKSNANAGLFLDAGLGKTSTSLDAIDEMIDKLDINAVLMVAPLRVIYTVWPIEVKKWDNFKHLKCQILHGKTKNKPWLMDTDIFLINPEGLPWLYETLVERYKTKQIIPFDCLWIDESTKFKSNTSARFRLLCDMLPLFDRRVIMTGTPAPKSMLDIWSQMYILDEGKLLGKSFHRFKNTYFEANDWNKYDWRIRDGAKEQITKLISPLILNMEAADHLEMPAVTYNHISVELPKTHLKTYKQMENDFFTLLDSDELTAQASAQAGMKCHQLANGKVYEDVPENLEGADRREFLKTRKVINVHDAKQKAIKELTDELNGKPLLIAYHYKHDLQALREVYGDELVHIGSGVSGDETLKIVDRWNAGKIRILAGHPASMGHGLNLQKGGNAICWYSLTWNLEEYLQFNARIYRQGVEGSVIIHHLKCLHTIDEAMIERLGLKAENQTDLRQSLSNYRSKR